MGEDRSPLSFRSSSRSLGSHMAKGADGSLSAPQPCEIPEGAPAGSLEGERDKGEEYL